MRPVIHSQKHYVQITRSSVLTVARNIEDIIISKATPTAVDEITEGAVVKAVYIELWLMNEGNDGSDVVIVSKHVADATGPNFTTMNALGNYANKKNVLFVHQGLSSNDGIGNPVAILRNWVKIPKSKQRFGLGDSLRITIANNGANSLDYCGFATYKEYT